MNNLKSLYYITQNKVFIQNLCLDKLENNFKVSIENINIVYWKNNNINYDNANCVINAFACKLPQHYQQTMPINIKWIQLDYLATEEWADEYHGLSAFINQHKRTFFTLGFTNKTAGLIIQDFAKLNINEKHELSKKYNINYKKSSKKLQKVINIFIFAYINSTSIKEIQNLYNVCTYLNYELNIYMPDSVYNNFIEYIQNNNINYYYIINVIPACSQIDFDKLLQLFNILWVRGEDSFVRSQLTSIPMIWQAYIQENNAQLDKVNGFLKKYLDFFDKKHQEIIKKIWLNINNSDVYYESAWRNFILILNDKNYKNSLNNWNNHLKNLPKLTEEILK